MSTQEIANKLWSLCNVLRDDGVTYHQYLNELTYILFLKLSTVKDFEDKIPEHYRWEQFTTETDNVAAFNLYREFLAKVATLTTDNNIKQIYTNASTTLTKPVNFRTLVAAIDDLDWYEDTERDAMGDIYESLLEKNAGEKKSGAGQYFTPRPLINVIVKLASPQLGERWSDPACGTFGFMISADHYLREKTDYFYKGTEKERNFQIKEAFNGVELVGDAHRLALMNAQLHGLESTIFLGDTLTDVGVHPLLNNLDGVLANPPFGTKKGGERPTRDDLMYLSGNKQLNFLQHIYRSLKKDGKARAAVVLPDNVLFEDGDGQKVRKELMEKCNLHTILRLPTGIFYAAGVKTNVLFFTRGKKDENNTDKVWFYDMRTNMPSFGKRTPFTEKAFDDFIYAYTGGVKAVDVMEYDGAIDHKKRTEITDERWQCISRADIARKNDSLDLGLIADSSIVQSEDLGEPEDLITDAIAELNSISQELAAILKELK
ncbi:N-6 DNA methylase [Myroides odoratimimus]|uniref:class I SAM-dependent DNA methyltransferase n=1 Tax=Myroides odoratimimus TaxID=76832 RepID=UPI0031018B70